MTEVKLPVLDWLGSPAKQSVQAVFDTLNTSTEALDLLRKYRSAHFKAIKTHLSQIKILGMSKPIDLRKIYHRPYVSDSIRGRLEATRVEDEPSSRARKTTATVGAETFIEQNHRAAVLGGPGSGKTTLLRWLALAYSDKKLFKKAGLTRSLFPFYVHIPLFAQSGKRLEEYLAAELIRPTDKHAGAWVNRVLKKGVGIVLLDSLDEVPMAQRRAITSEIRAFAATFPDTKIVLTCRTADYQAWFENFSDAEMQRLTTEGVNAIIRGWFEGDAEKAERLIRLLKSDKGVSALTQTPLLLSLLCIQFKHDHSLPPSRKTQLYRRCVEALLRDWDTSRGFRRDSAYSKLSDDRREFLFETTAANFMTDPPRFVFPEVELRGHIRALCGQLDIDPEQAGQILHEIESHHGILERASAKAFQFSHQSFQEYFSARRFLALGDELSVLRKHHDQPQWASTIEFMVALSQNPGDMLEELKKRSKVSDASAEVALARRVKTLVLLYRCLSLGPLATPDTMRELADHIVDGQLAIIELNRKVGILPFAALQVPDGIKHFYFATAPEVKALPESLYLLQRLGNVIGATPVRGYPECVLRRVAGFKPSEEQEAAAGLLCLAVPLARSCPAEAKQALEVLANMKGYVARYATDSLEALSKLN